MDKRHKMINQFKNYLILLVITAILPGCAAIKAMKLFDSGEAVPGDYTESAVPYTMAGHPIIIKAKLNNSEKEYNFIFDTGALTMIRQEVAKELDLSSSLYSTSVYRSVRQISFLIDPPSRDQGNS
jgi:hypothetical protein